MAQHRKAWTLRYSNVALEALVLKAVRKRDIKTENARKTQRVGFSGLALPETIKSYPRSMDLSIVHPSPTQIPVVDGVVKFLPACQATSVETKIELTSQVQDDFFREIFFQGARPGNPPSKH